MSTGPLQGVTILEIGAHTPARYCGLAFARGGAAVLSAAVARSAASREDELLGRYLDHGKHVLRTNAEIDAAAASADLLLGDHESDWERFAACGRWHGRTVPFGPAADGRAGWTASELVVSCLGGAADFTRAPNGTPLYGFGHRYEFLAGLYLYFALLCRMTGGGQPVGRGPGEVTVSVLETVVSMLPCHTTQFEYNGNTDTVGQTGARHVLACKDGWIAVYAGGPWANIVGFLGTCAPEHDEIFVQNGSRVMHTAELDTLLQARVRTMTVAEALARGHETNVAVAAVPDPASVLDDPVLGQRRFWEIITLPDGTQGKAPRSGALVNGMRV